MNYHNPVLLKESIEGLAVRADGTYVDVTFGGGGHSAEILKRLKSGRLIAFDQDEDAIKNNAINDEKFELIHQNFRFLKDNLKLKGIDFVDGIIADLGVSSHQFDDPERGFSTRFNTRLDLRMDKKNELSALIILNTYTVDQLKEIFALYGELKNAKKIARDIDFFRRKEPLTHAGQLKNILKNHYQEGRENKFLAKVFQALRIMVNDELEALKELLLQVIDILKSKGRLVVISYHSLEDRLVKNFMKSGNMEGLIMKDFFGNILTPFHMITKKPLVPDILEMKNNNRSRSAKLRIAEKV